MTSASKAETVWAADGTAEAAPFPDHGGARGGETGNLGRGGDREAAAQRSGRARGGAREMGEAAARRGGGELRSKRPGATAFA